MAQARDKARAAAKWVAVALVLAAEAVAQRQPDAPQAERHVIISIPDRKLALLQDGEVLKIYRVAVGARTTPSPTGQFTVVTRIPDPTWYFPGKVIGPGPDNPLGSRWIGLSLKGFGIHGTNAPNSIGRAASHGCIRVGKADVEELFALLRVGDTVEIRGERDEELAQIFNESTVVAQAQMGAAAGGQ